jgi:arsenite methyltransferase
MENKNEMIREKVRKGYADIAQGKAHCCGGAPAPNRFAQAIGYSAEELDHLPEDANMALSCGNPTALANLRPGQVVLDLGSGGGFDVFIAARKVGSAGRAIGVDMTPDMLSRARQSIAVFTAKTGLANVEFRLGEIEHLPVADSSVDVVISNCVINLSPDKPQVWREIARVLRPGGKACVSDLALAEDLPAAVKASVTALVGCVAGAVRVDETLDLMKAAGLTDIEHHPKTFNMDIIEDCNDALYKAVRSALPVGKKLSDYIVSVDYIGFKKE